MDEMLPEDPMTAVQQGWVAVHEVFIQLREAGFSVMEAACVVVAMMSVVPGQGTAESQE